jgi:hypothetical protein
MRRQLAESWDQISAEAGFCFSFRAGTRPPANQTNCPQRPSAEVLMKSLAAVLESELAALRIWQSARNPQRDLAVPDEIWDGMTISIDKIEAPLRKAELKPKRKPNEVEYERSQWTCPCRGRGFGKWRRT